MNDSLICEFIDAILSAVASQKIDQSEAREYLVKVISLACNQQKNLETYVEAAIGDIAGS